MPRRPIRLVAAFAAALLILAACGDEEEDGPLAPPPAAVVNGERITTSELQSSIPLFEFLGAIQQQGCGTPEPGERPDAACARFVLYRLVEEQLVKAHAADADLEVDQAELDDTFGSFEEQLGPRLDTLLQEHELDRDEVRAFVERLLLYRTVETDLAEEDVSEEELRQAYEDRKVEFTTIHTWHILVEEEELANRLAKEVTAENFQELARKHSTDPSAAQNSGDLGPTPASQLDATYSQTAIDLEPGQISEPVKTQFGWHIIRLIEEETAPFEEVRTFLIREEAGDVLGEWLKEELAAADIEVNPRYGRLDIENRQIEPITSTATEEGTPTGGPTEGGTATESGAVTPTDGNIASPSAAQTTPGS